MAAGSEAAQHVAQLVLLSNFSAMPQIVKKGGVSSTISNVRPHCSL
ncbi:MAG: hypothetical protein ACLRZH_17990 [Ruthenibacterium lactatiformans]